MLKFGTDLNVFERGLFLKLVAWRSSLSSNCLLIAMVMTIVEIGVALVVHDMNCSNSNSKDNNNALMANKTKHMRATYAVTIRHEPPSDYCQWRRRNRP